MDLVPSPSKIGFSVLFRVGKGGMNWRLNPWLLRSPNIKHIVPVARLEDFRALKSSNLEDFRVLKPYGQIGGFEGPKILQIGGF